MTYLMDEKTFNELKWRAENGLYKAHTRRQECYASGMLEVIRKLEENRIKEDIVITKKEIENCVERRQNQADGR